MILLIRENISKDSVEFLWNGDSISWKGSKPYIEKPIQELQSFWQAWQSLVFRFGQSTNVIPEILDELQRKKDWLAGLVGWSRINLDPLSKHKIISIQSDTKWLSLPWELLIDINKDIQVIREFLTPQNDLPLVATDQAFFLFQTEFGGKLETSLEQEYENLSSLDWKDIRPRFYKNGLARVERVKEILPSAKLFYLASHLDPGEWILPDGSRLEKSEIESMNLSGLELVFLNGCYSAFGLAQSFLKSGAREVVGFTTAVPNEVSEEVSIIFWKEWISSRSSEKSYLKVKHHLNTSILKYSWIRFGDGKITKKLKWIPYLLLAISSLVSIILLIFFNSFKERNLDINKQSKPITQKKESIPIKKSQISNDNIITMKSKIRLSESIQSNKQIDVKINEEPKIPISSIEDNSKINLENNLPISFRNKIQAYIDDESEVLPKPKRILLVQRILNRPESPEWKEDIFHQETGR